MKPWLTVVVLCACGVAPTGPVVVDGGTTPAPMADAGQLDERPSCDVTGAWRLDTQVVDAGSFCALFHTETTVALLLDAGVGSPWSTAGYAVSWATDAGCALSLAASRTEISASETLTTTVRLTLSPLDGGYEGSGEEHITGISNCTNHLRATMRRP